MNPKSNCCGAEIFTVPDKQGEYKKGEQFCSRCGVFQTPAPKDCGCQGLRAGHEDTCTPAPKEGSEKGVYCDGCGHVIYPPVPDDESGNCVAGGTHGELFPRPARQPTQERWEEEFDEKFLRRPYEEGIVYASGTELKSFISSAIAAARKEGYEEGLNDNWGGDKKIQLAQARQEGYERGMEKALKMLSGTRTATLEEVEKEIGKLSIYDIDDTPRTPINMNGYNDGIGDSLKALASLKTPPQGTKEHD